MGHFSCASHSWIHTIKFIPGNLLKTTEQLSVEQEDTVKNMNVTEDDYGQSWKNGPYYYYDHISDSDNE